jgi:ferredoxin-thioredoxin reductase catalytic subunit
MTLPVIPDSLIETTYQSLKKEAKDSGYRLNPDIEFTKNLVRGLLKNEQRYGYQACPCRLATGKKEEDLDIICPCDYRDPDLDDFGACYCALYVTGVVIAGQQNLSPIPERRPPRADRNKIQPVPPKGQNLPNALPFPVWRCKVCGYLCARDHPPDICPICKVSKDRFERFI